VTAYLDTSVLLRLVLREPEALDDLRSYDALVSRGVADGGDT
jgi:predicted nucleic acid-binding protein